MIGYLSGKVNFKNTDSINLLTGGVGFNVFVSPTLLSKLTNNENAELFVYTLVREDTLDLYGFNSQSDLQFFKLLLNVSGIGAKTALLVVDKGVEDVTKAITEANVDFFTIIPRLGRKNAQKIIIELKNKIGGINELNLQQEGTQMSEVIDALASMGYNRQDINKVLQKVPADFTKVEDRIRFALQHLGKAK